VAKKVREVIAALEEVGWVQVRQTGGHRQFKHAESLWTITVAGKRSDTVPVGTLSKIRNQSGLDYLR
jgi:predicted RNA binding protein YcfA (HicA-like mRNA interferase family)